MMRRQSKSEKEVLIDTISAEVSELENRLGWRGLSDEVLAALRQVPRDQFVAKENRYRAWENHPLSIGYQQTISQPFIVAIMTQLLHPEKNHRVLEVGTGCGYQAAVLSCLVEQVYSVEVIPALTQESELRLKNLGYNNISLRCGDGYSGWPERAPFDGIIVTAGTEMVPAPLISQLKVGGRMVIPVGPTHESQMLKVLTKVDEHSVDIEDIIPVVFVPFVRSTD
ncbi:MAG: protein-L-isoaspartate(D-aspartate) O-methyltransferase [Pseudomonadales bacterium]|nr:protein-L-isoaspartate(D-aspartate) O-methyltransferase [Pseudomonadales bacterium]